jgi:hypothetical protein
MFGLVFGPVLFQNVPLGFLAGALIGILAGAAYSTRAK